MRWKVLRNDAGQEYAIISDCGLAQIAKYPSSPRYCLFTREQLGKPFSVVMCGDDSGALRELAAARRLGHTA